MCRALADSYRVAGCGSLEKTRYLLDVANLHASGELDLADVRKESRHYRIRAKVHRVFNQADGLINH